MIGQDATPGVFVINVAIPWYLYQSTLAAAAERAFVSGIINLPAAF